MKKSMIRIAWRGMSGAVALICLLLFGCEPVENPTTSTTSDSAETYTVTITSNYFSKTGSEYNWFDGDGVSAKAYIWAQASSGAPFNSGRWQAPFAKSGVYAVRVYLPGEPNMAANVRYDVVANGQTKNVSLNQTTNPKKWVSLGSFTFSGQGYEYVELTNVTGSASGHVVFSAVEFVRETVDANPTPTPTPTATPKAN